MFQRAFTAAALASALLLAGCATGPAAITSQVQSYASMQGVALPSTYRLEVLPSQAQQASFARIEMAADTALTKVGLQRAPRPEQAKLVVQVGASAGEGRAQHPTWDPYYYGPRFGWGLGYGGGWYSGWNMHWMLMDTPPRVYLRAVKLVLRDAQSQRIVYETSAQYDEVRVNDDTIWQVLFDAALTGFPAPPAGPRQVTLLPAPAPAEAPAPQAPASVPLPAGKPVDTTLSAPAPAAPAGAVPATAAPVNGSAPVRPASELGR